MRRLLAMLAWVAVVPVAAAAQAKVEFLTPYGPPTRPFSPAVRAGNLLFVAGQIGTPMNNLGNAATNRLGVASDAILNYVNVARQ